MATLTTETITSEYFELFLWFFGFIRLLFVFFLEDFISLADKNGWTALHGAASEGTDSIWCVYMTFLISKRSNIKSGHIDTCMILLDHAADPSLQVTHDMFVDVSFWENK